MKIFAMSDIHGMYDAFMRRIGQLNNLDSIKKGKDKLILLGDYIDVGRDSFKVLNTIYELQQYVSDKNMIVLMGNHDRWFLDFLDGKNDDWLYEARNIFTLESFLVKSQVENLNTMINTLEPGRIKTGLIIKYIKECLSSKADLLRWYRNLPLYHKTKSQIFVHAGIGEEADDWWETGTSDEMFVEKYPPTTGKFYMDIIAGHVSTSTASNNKELHDIYYDGESHFYIDGIDSYHYEIPDADRVIPVLVYDDAKRAYYSLSEDGEYTLLRDDSRRKNTKEDSVGI